MTSLVEDASISVIVLARGDFNNDGVEDIMLDVRRFPNQGTFVNFEIMIVTRLKPGVPLTIVSDN